MGIKTAGSTTNFVIDYDDSLTNSQAGAQALLSAVENEFGVLTGWFNVPASAFGTSNQITVTVNGTNGGGANQGYTTGGASYITVDPQSGNSDVATAQEIVKMTFVAEFVEILMTYHQETVTTYWNSGWSDGEGLSRFCAAERFYAGWKAWLSGYSYNNGQVVVWLDPPSTRPDWITKPKHTDQDTISLTCGMLYIYYLRDQLGFHIDQIIASYNSNLGSIYNTLTGDPSNAYDVFRLFIDAVFPPGSYAGLPPAHPDDPFPAAGLAFWIDKVTYGRDEVQDAITAAAGTAIYRNAFWLVLEQISINMYNSLSVNIPLPLWQLGVTSLDGITVSPSPTNAGDPAPPNPIPQYEDLSSPGTPQRIRFAYDITITSLDAFPAPGDANIARLVDLAAFANAGSNPLTGASTTATFEFTAGEDPYFTNLDPSNPNAVPFLSQDLRVFAITANAAPVPGAQNTTTDGYASIQNLLGYLNSSPTFTTPSATSDPLDLLPDQADNESTFSSVTPDNTAKQTTYNFAIARVRLRGTAGNIASNVRVFFRLWVAVSVDTDYNPNTTYKSTQGTDSSGFTVPIFPLPSASLNDPTGQTLRSVPYFATDASGTHDYDGTVPNGNIQSIKISADPDGIWTYFGCFIDIYNSLGKSKWAGTHHCIVAEIAYDLAPIATSDTIVGPQSSDKLAQRNLQVTTSENPQSPATHRIPQAFDTFPSISSNPVPGILTTYPDELMIDWGNTPPGSLAYIYWPDVAASDVLGLANSIYSTHLLSASDANTLRCVVPTGVTYIPIPAGAGKCFAGLFDIDLPPNITFGQEFNVIVRRIRSKSPRAIDFVTHLSPPSAPAPGQSETSTTPSQVVIGSRYTVGSFRVKIPVVKKATMLPQEENTLAILKWRLEQMSPVDRWRPVIERYLGYISARVDGLGGDANAILPSPTGVDGNEKTPTGGYPDPFKDRQDYTGKVTGVAYDRFGDFEGFSLLTETGFTHWFVSREGEIERLVKDAWEDRSVITVLTSDYESHIPVNIILRRYGWRHER